MTRYEAVTHTAMAALVVVSTFAVVTAVGAGALVAGTGVATAAHDSPGDYTVELPEPDDPLPGSENPEGASVYHLAGLDGGLEDAPADRYESLEWLVISSDEIDFSGCETDDTNGLGIDRGNDNEGTQFDDDLIQHRKDSAFLEDEIWVEFYGPNDLGGDTIGITEEDGIVATQLDCYTMPEEPGWYQIDGEVNGTGPDGEFFETSLTSHYFPVCDGCHDEATAEEQLGPAPSQQDDGTEASTPTPASDDGTPTPEAADPTPTPAPEDSTPTPTESGSGESPATPTDASAEPTPTDANGGTAGNGDSGGVSGTPTPADGPGFTAVMALLALLASALLVRRR